MYIFESFSLANAQRSYILFKEFIRIESKTSLYLIIQSEDI